MKILQNGDIEGFPDSSPLIFLVQNRIRILVCFSAAFFISCGVALLLPRYYASDVLIMPPAQPSVNPAFSQLANLAGVSSSGIGAKTPDEIYVAFLKTRRVADRIIKKFDLLKRYDAETLEDARAQLDDLLAVGADKKSGLIRVSFLDKDPAFAAVIANAYADELKILLSDVSVTEAQRRRKFYELQVAEAQSALNKLEDKLRIVRQEKGIYANQVVAESDISSSVTLRKLILEKEIQLDARRNVLTPNNADYKILQTELSALKNKLEALEHGVISKDSGSAQENEAFKILREIRFGQAALDALVLQYGAAKLDEAREGPAMQIVDGAVPTKKASRPNRKMIVFFGSILGLIIGVISSLKFNNFQRTLRN